MFSTELFVSPSINSAWSALGWAVIHFLWQGALIGLATAALLDLMGQKKPSSRYLIATVAMFVSVFTFSGTFLWTLSQATSITGLPVTSTFTPPLFVESTRVDISSFAAWAWSLGLALMSIRLMRQCIYTRRLIKSAVKEPSLEWRTTFQSLKEELGINRSIRFLQSGLAKSPMVVGWITPAILVPVSTFTALTPEQLRVILAHELAHIRRHDHLVNLAQCIIESILFFHPFTWWISKQIRQEREHSCDDIAASSKSDRLKLAHALTQLESIRITPPKTSLAANGGSLMNRITRILDLNTADKHPKLSNRSFLSGAAALLFAAVSLTTLGASCVNNAAEEGAQLKSDFTKEQFAQRAEKLEAMVESGEISREDADLRHGQMRRRFAASQESQSEEHKGFTRGEYARAKKNIDGMVKAGEVSQEDADKRLGQMRNMIRSEGRGKTKLVAAEEFDRAETEYLRRIESAVEAGEITREEADEKYEGIKARLDAGGETAARASARLDYANAEAKIKAMVAEGKVSQEDAETRLKQMRERMTNEGQAKSKIKAVEEFDWAETERRIESAVEAGEITREEADEKYRGIKARLDAGGETADRTAARLDYANAEAKIKAMVEAGEISAEDAEKRLNRMRERIAGDGDKKQSEGARTFTIEEYKEAAAKIKAMVEAGEVSAEDAEIRLNRMRQATERKTRGPK